MKEGSSNSTETAAYSWTKKIGSWIVSDLRELGFENYSICYSFTSFNYFSIFFHPLSDKKSRFFFFLNQLPIGAKKN